MTVEGMNASQWARIVTTELELDMTAGAAHLVEVLAHYCGEQGDAWPSVETLMTRMRRKRRFVEEARAELVRIGLLEAVSGQRGGRRKADGRGITARYRLTLPVIQNPAPSCGVLTPKVIQNPAQNGREPRTPVRTKSHRSPTVNTSTDAVPRGADHDGPRISVHVEHLEGTDATSWEGFYAPVIREGPFHVR